MTKSPLVSVVIPAMDEAKYIGPCIASLKNQTYSNFEVIVVFLGHDATADMCRAAGWKVVDQKDKGVSSGRGQGFAKASGEIIASTDADTKVDNKWLENIVERLKNPDVVCVYGPTFLYPPTIVYRLSSFLSTLFQQFNRLIGNDNIYGMNFAVKKSAYIACGGFDPKRVTAEDIDLGYRIKKFGQIKFFWDIKVYTSDRRLKHQGPIRFALRHIRNYLSMVLFHHSGTDFEPIR